ncbi:MAG: hypothetical protein WD696_18795 [Bryobacteraceae bacterium]
MRFFTIFFLLAALWGIALSLARRSPPGLTQLFAWGLLFRLILIPAGMSFETGQYQRLLLYDDDIWRYLWEGHVWSAGVNPMQVPPAELEEYDLELRDPALHRALFADRQWSENYDNIGYREIASPYPPMAQAVFRLAHLLDPGSIPVFKLLMIAFDLGVAWLLWLLTRDGFVVLAWTWNPLVVKEFAGSGHIDAVLVFLLVAAVLHARSLGSIWLALAALVKPVPLLLAPAFFKRGGIKALIAPIGAAAAILFAMPTGMRDYARHWTFNAALFRLLPVERDAAMIIGGVALALLTAWWFRRDDRSEEMLTRQAVWLIGAFLLVTPMFGPWYLTWIIPFAAIRRAWFWLALSATIFLSYHAYLEFRELPLLVAMEFAIPLAVYLWLRRDASLRPQSYEK